MINIIAMGHIATFMTWLIKFLVLISYHRQHTLFFVILKSLYVQTPMTETIPSWIS